MPRGRPQIYKTPEDKARANREKSKRSYHKQKVAISSRRVARRYRHERVKNKPILGAAPAEAPPSVYPDPDDVPAWMALVSQVAAKTQELIKGSIHGYFQQICQRFIFSLLRNEIDDAAMEFESMKTTIQRCGHALLQVVGVGDKYRAAERVEREIDQVICCFDDIMCHLLVGKAELFDMYSSEQLMYQSLV